MNLEEAIALLKEKKCRITKPRKEILSVLVRHQTILLSAEDILQELSKKNSDINLTTVYRNLELLNNMGMLLVQSKDRKTQSYKIICMKHHHHHITCTQCGEMKAIDYCPISNSLSTLAHHEGYVLTDHVMELYGICSSCQSDHRIH